MPRTSPARPHRTLGDRDPRGFTLMELSLGLAAALFSLLAMGASTLRSHELRLENRQRALAAEALRARVDSIRALSDALRAQRPDAPGAWSSALVAALAPERAAFDVPGLEPLSDEAPVGAVRVVADETLCDARLGVELGMPRDLDGDGDAADVDVVGRARLHPVIVSVSWRAPSGPQTLRQPLYLVGY